MFAYRRLPRDITAVVLRIRRCSGIGGGDVPCSRGGVSSVGGVGNFGPRLCMAVAVIVDAMRVAGLPFWLSGLPRLLLVGGVVVV